MRTPPARTVLVLGAILATLAAGCVRRTMTIRTEPAGALVFLNDQEVGRSPASTDFLWYGDYDLILRKEGCETLQTHVKVTEPWYQVPPIDFFAEVLWPWWIHDTHSYDFALAPKEPPDREEVLQRAQETRERALYEAE